jgi:hypothetical protein
VANLKPCDNFAKQLNLVTISTLMNLQYVSNTCYSSGELELHDYSIKFLIHFNEIKRTQRK